MFKPFPMLQTPRPAPFGVGSQGAEIASPAESVSQLRARAQAPEQAGSTVTQLPASGRASSPRHWALTASQQQLPMQPGHILIWAGIQPESQLELSSSCDHQPVEDTVRLPLPSAQGNSNSMQQAQEAVLPLLGGRSAPLSLAPTTSTAWCHTSRAAFTPSAWIPASPGNTARHARNGE